MKDIVFEAYMEALLEEWSDEEVMKYMLCVSELSEESIDMIHEYVRPE